MNVDAVILRRIPAGEHDQAVVAYGLQTGKFVAIAKGSLRRGSRQGLALDDGNLIRCELVPGRGGMSIMTGAQAQRCWATAKASAPAWAAAGAFLQAADALIWEGQPDDRIWDLVLTTLASLDAAEDPLMAFRRAQVGLLEALGYGVRPLPTGRPGRSLLDDELEQVAQRHLAGPDFLYRLLAMRPLQ